MIPLVVHPVHVRLAAPAGQPPRDVLARRLCPVRLHERETDEFAPLTQLPGVPGGRPRTILAGPDGLWQPLATAEGAPVAEADLVAYLCDAEVPAAVRAACDAALAGTPVLARAPGEETGEGAPNRGSAVDRREEAGAVEDAQDQARHDLAAFLRDEVALVEGRTLLRVRPVALIDHRRRALSGFAPVAAAHGLAAFPARPETFRDAAAAANLASDGDPAILDRWLGLAGSWADDHDELRWALNAWAAPVGRALDAELRAGGLAANLRDAMADVRLDVRRVEIRALTGQAGRAPAERGGPPAPGPRLDLAGCHAILATALDLLAVHGRGRESASLAPLAWMAAGLLRPRVPAGEAEAPRLSRTIS